MSAVEKARKEWNLLDDRKNYYVVHASELSEIVDKHNNNLISGCMDLFIFAFMKGVRFQRAMERKQVKA